MLKHTFNVKTKKFEEAATFGWLCVETTLSMRLVMVITAATFGWLCVETTTKRKTR